MVVRLLLVWCFRSLSTKSFPTKPTFENPRKHIFPPLPFLLAEKEKESAVITHSKLTKKMVLKESGRDSLVASENTFGFFSIILTGGSSFLPGGKGESEAATIDELTSNLQT